MGLGNLLKSAISSATEYALETGETKLNNRRLVGYLRQNFKKPRSAQQLSVGNFVSNMFGDEAKMEGLPADVDGGELSKFADVWNIMVEGFWACHTNVHEEGPFITQKTWPEEQIGWLRDNRNKAQQKEEIEAYIAEAATSDLSEDSFHDVSMPCFEVALRKLKECSIAKSVGIDEDENFQIWLEEAVDPILEAIHNERSALEQLLAGCLPAEAHISAFKEFLENEAKIDDLIGENQGEMVRLYKAMHDAFDRKGLIAINKLATVPKDVHRINQIETIIDLYNLKISRTEKDKKMDADVKARKVQALQHLMEKDIEALGGAV